MKTFHIGVILSALSGKLVAPDGIADIYTFTRHMTGEDVFTHQIPRVLDECRSSLCEQFPDLAAVKVPEFDDAEHVWRWLAEQVGRYGADREVAPLALADHTDIDPLVELQAMMRPDAEIIAVTMDGSR